MSKTFAVVLGVIVLIGVCIWFCPCRKAMTCAIQGMMGNKARMGCQLNGQGPMMGQMRGQGMENKIEKEVLLAPDGGLFVVVGNKIIKYDKDLNLVKEVELMNGPAVLRNDQMGMKRGCPMMKGVLRADEVDKSNSIPVNK